MGKGDIRSRRGKIWRGTYGVSRPSKRKKRVSHFVASSRKAKSLKDLPKMFEPIREEVPVELKATEMVAPADVQHLPAEPVTQTPVLDQKPVELAQDSSEAKTVEKKAAKKTGVRKASSGKKGVGKKTSVRKTHPGKTSSRKKK